MANNPIVNIFRIKELRSRIIFTLAILVVYRFGSVLTIPGIDPQVLTAYFSSSGNAFVDYMDFFVGGAFSNFSVFMLGVMPYISTQILFQLAMVIFPSLKKVAEDDGGRRKIQTWIRMATVGVALIQSLAVTFFAAQIPGVVVIESHALHVFVTMITVTTGTMIAIWLGEQITARGIGNGISMLIFAGIVARLPQAIIELFRLVNSNDPNVSLNPVFVIIAFIMFIGIVVLVVYEHQGQRKIPVHYAKRVVGRRMYSIPPTYIPFKINPSGVIPVIFASSFLMLPLQLLQSFAGTARWVRTLHRILRADGLVYNILIVLLVIFFAYFYTQVSLNPTEIAKQLRENGGSIPGIRMDKTEEYLQRILDRLVFPGALYLASIAVLPTLIHRIFGFPSSIAALMGGTSLIILVGVDLDTMSQIEAQLKMHNYDGLTKKGKLRGRGF